MSAYFSAESIRRLVSLTKATKEALPHLQNETLWVYDFRNADGELGGLIVIDGDTITAVKHSTVKVGSIDGVDSIGGCCYGENARRLLAKWREDA